MPELDDAALERRLRGVLKEHLGALPLDLTVDALDRRREAKGLARRSSRGRGITMLAAAALLLVGGALAAGSGLLRLPSVVPPLPAPSVIAIATASPDATFPSPSESAAPSASPIPVVDPNGGWISTGSMGTSRERVDFVRLLDGRVLVVGPATGDADGTSAELYDPDSGTWSATGNMLKPRSGFPATLLRDGRVLVGDVEDPDGDRVYGAEVYDPETGTWSATGPMVGPLAGGHSAVLLRDGRVLVMHYLGRSELYDPDRGTWTATGKTVGGGGTATLLRDGTVLNLGLDRSIYPTDSAELYDPDTGTWTAIASMPSERKIDGAVLLPDGKVLVVGSYSSGESALLYDPATGAWTATGDLTRPDASYEAITLLADGTVLVTGTVGDRADPSAELYDPDTRSWTTIAPMLRSTGTSAVLLLDGTVLVAGDGTEAELYVPAGVSPPAGLPTSPPPTPIPTPTPTPTPIPMPFPAQAGPVPPDARSWTVTVRNRSSQPSTLFVAEETEHALMGPLVGSATPNVVAPGATVKVTFLLPAKGTAWAIFVNPGPAEGLPIAGPAEMSMRGQIHMTTSGQPAWVPEDQLP